jgi:hypothetical protein
VPRPELFRDMEKLANRRLITDVGRQPYKRDFHDRPISQSTWRSYDNEKNCSCHP